MLDASHFSPDGYRDHSAAVRNLANARIEWALDNDRKFMLV